MKKNRRHIYKGSFRKANYDFGTQMRRYVFLFFKK